MTYKCLKPKLPQAQRFISYVQLKYVSDGVIKKTENCLLSNCIAAEVPTIVPFVILLRTILS